MYPTAYTYSRAQHLDVYSDQDKSIRGMKQNLQYISPHPPEPFLTRLPWGLLQAPFFLRALYPCIRYY